MRRTVPALALVLLSACTDRAGTLLSPELGARSDAKPAQPTIVDVVTTIYDRDASSTLLPTQSDDFNGAGFATYTSVSKVTSQIRSDGGWQLYLGNQTARTIRLALASQGIPIPDGNYSANVEVYGACFNANDVRVNLLAMSAGEVNENCSFGFDVSVGRTKYKLTMGNAWPGTGRAKVTCNAADASGCSNWSFVPDLAAANAGVANLYHFANNGSLVLDGVYHNSYSVVVMR
jgi:hypothetical protein